MANRNITLKRNNAGTTEELYPTTDWSQVNSKPSTFTPTAHSHGNITNGGAITANATIATGDHLVIADNSASNTLTTSSITFDTTNTSTFLRRDGTWSTVEASGNQFVNISGDTMTGNLQVNAEIRLNDSNTIIKEGGSNSVRIQTNSGNIDIGPHNTAWAHFYTDRPRFYFGKGVDVDGDIRPYSNNTTKIQESTGHIFELGNRVLTTASEGSGNGLDADTVDTKHASDFATRIDLSSQVQLSSYRKSVIALCELTNTNPSANSWSGGTLYFHRTNGLAAPVTLQIAMEKRYNVEGANYTALAMSGDSYGNNIQYVQFDYNGTTYGGIEFYFSAAEHHKVYFIGETNFDIFGLDYYNTQTSTVLNSEVNSSISTSNMTAETDFFYNNNTIWHSGNDGTGSGLDADTVDGIHASAFVRSDASDTMSGDYRIESGSFASLILDRGTTGSGSIVQFENNNGVIGGIGAYGDDGLQFRTTDGTQMIINASNNVGIGTTSPTGKLDVRQGYFFALITGADVNASTLTNNSRKYTRIGMPHYTNTQEPVSLITGDSDGTNNLVYIGGGTSAGNAATQIHLKTSSNATTTVGTTRLFVGSDGNVGIGTTSPDAKLDVAGGITATGNIESDANILIDGSLYLNQDNTAGNSYVFFGDAASDTAHYLQFSDATQKFTLTDDLIVTGDVTVNGSFTMVDTNTSTTEQWSVTNDGTGPAVIINQTGAQPIMDVQDDGTTAFYIEDGGNVGIKTTNPTTTLQVAGRALANILSTTTASTRDKIRLYDTSAQYTIGMQGGVSYGGLNNDWAMTFQFNNDNDRGFWWGDEAHTTAQGAMALTTNGLLTVANRIRVGYGESDTTIPATYALDVSGQVQIDDYTSTRTAGLLKINSESGSGWDSQSGAALGKIQFWSKDASGIGEHEIGSIELENDGSNYYQPVPDMIFKTALYNTAAAERMRITSDGKVGIGTSTPTEKLTVYGDSNTSENSPVTFIKHNFTGTHGFGLSISRDNSDVAALALGSNSSNHGIVVGNNTNLILGTISSGVVNDAINIKTGGNVGIGTNSPSDTLHIEGNQIISKSTTGGQNQIRFQEAGTTKTQITSNYGDNKFYLYHEGGNRLVIDSSGQIGVGTSSPAYAVDVAGDVNVTGNFKINGTNIATGTAAEPEWEYLTKVTGASQMTYSSMVPADYEYKFVVEVQTTAEDTSNPYIRINNESTQEYSYQYQSVTQTAETTETVLNQGDAYTSLIYTGADLSSYSTGGTSASTIHRAEFIYSVSPYTTSPGAYTATIRGWAHTHYVSQSGASYDGMVQSTFVGTRDNLFFTEHTRLDYIHDINAGGTDYHEMRVYRRPRK